MEPPGNHAESVVRVAFCNRNRRGKTTVKHGNLEITISVRRTDENDDL